MRLAQYIARLERYPLGKLSLALQYATLLGHLLHKQSAPVGRGMEGVTVTRRHGGVHRQHHQPQATNNGSGKVVRQESIIDPSTPFHSTQRQGERHTFVDTECRLMEPKSSSGGTLRAQTRSPKPVVGSKPAGVVKGVVDHPPNIHIIDRSTGAGSGYSRHALLEHCFVSACAKVGRGSCMRSHDSPSKTGPPFPCRNSRPSRGHILTSTR